MSSRCSHAFERGRRRQARREHQRRLLESYEFETSDAAPNPIPAKAMLRALGQPAGQCRLPMGPAPEGLEAATPRRGAGVGSVAERRQGHLPRRARRDRAQLRVHRARRPHHAPRLRADVPRRRHARHRPRAARLHLPARERRPHRGLHRHPRPRGPRRRPVVPAARAVVPDLRLGAHARPGPQPHRGGRPARPHRADPGGRRRAPPDRPVRRASSSPSPTRCPTASPPRSTPRRASILHTGDFKLDLTPVDGRLTDLARIGALADQTASACCWPTPPTPTSRATSRSETSVGKVLYDLFHEHEGQRIITACFASHIHRVQQIADAAIAYDRVIATLGMSMRKNVRLAREMGLLHIPEQHAARHRGRRATSTRPRCA